MTDYTPRFAPASVLHGDCLEIMRQFPDNYFNCLISDPPYGTTNLAFDRQPIDWPAFWAEARRICTREAVMLLFADGLFTVDLIQSNRAEYRYRLVWKKTRGTGFLDANRRPLRKHEDIVMFCRAPKSSTYNPQRQAAESYTASTFKDGELPDGSHWGNGKGRHAWVDDGTRHPGSVLEFASIRSQDSLHPTQKPVDLMRFLVASYSNPGDLILDPFAGSGSTGVACVQLGREFIGVELNPEYHAVATQRLAATLPDGVTIDLPAPDDSLFGGVI